MTALRQQLKESVAIERAKVLAEARKREQAELYLRKLKRDDPITHAIIQDQPLEDSGTIERIKAAANEERKRLLSAAAEDMYIALRHAESALVLHHAGDPEHKIFRMVVKALRKASARHD